MERKIFVILIIILLFGGIFNIYRKRTPSKPKDLILPEEIISITPYPTWILKPGVKKPKITYEVFPFKSTDKTRKVEIFGCFVDNSEWGMSYPKKVIEVPNVSAIATETIKAFLSESANNGWGGIPSRAQIKVYEEIMRKTYSSFFYKNGEVVLEKLTIDKSGTARIYFSKEMEAYGGGSARVRCIQDSIGLTLNQFSNIKNIVPCIDKVCSDQKGSTLFQP